MVQIIMETKVTTVFYVFQPYRVWREMLEFLVLHYGDWFTGVPNLSWSGSGYSLSWRPTGQDSCWVVNIQDPEVKTMFLLRWS